MKSFSTLTCLMAALFTFTLAQTVPASEYATPTEVAIAATTDNSTATDVADVDLESGHFNGTHTVYLGKRAEYPGVYICSGTNWSGKCYWQMAGGGACHNFGGDFRGWSSFGVCLPFFLLHRVSC